MGTDENLKEFSALVDQISLLVVVLRTLLILLKVINTLLEPFSSLVPGSLVYLLACGLIMANKESFSLLYQTLKWYGFSLLENLVADGFQPECQTRIGF